MKESKATRIVKLSRVTSRGEDIWLDFNSGLAEETVEIIVASRKQTKIWLSLEGCCSEAHFQPFELEFLSLGQLNVLF